MRIIKEQRILNSLQNMNLDDDCIALMKNLISIARHGSIPGFVYMLDDIRKKVFADNHSRFVIAYKNLLDTGLITLQGTTLIINAWQKPSSIYQMQINIHNYTTPRRQYTRIIDEQSCMASFNDYVQSKKPEEKNFIWNKIKGIIVPRSLAGLFTRKVYDSELTKLDSAWLLREEERRMLSKEEIRYLCGLLSQCNTFGQIKGFNTHYSILAMKDLFEDESFAVSTGYRVQKSLLDKDIISICSCSKTGSQTLNINGYRDGFGKGRNYVVLPYAIFRTIFKSLELAAINLFFEEVFQLNNGDNGRGNASAHKKVKLKLLAAGMDTRTDKEKLIAIRTWLRKRNDSEVFKLIQGLKEFFDLEYMGNGVISFKIKLMYFVLKDAVRRVERAINPIKRYWEKAELIKECLDAYALEYKKQDLQDLIMVFSRAAARITRRVIKALAIDIRTRKQNNRPAIKSLGAYVSSLYNQYVSGNWTDFSGTIAYVESLRRDALDKLSEAPEMI